MKQFIPGFNTTGMVTFGKYFNPGSGMGIID
jgi:hypothetical protein